MPAQFSRKDIEPLAPLAPLELDDAQPGMFARQLAPIRASADQVQSVDTTGVPPTTHVATRHRADRNDEVLASLDRLDVLDEAPEPAASAGFFKVPRIIG